MNTDNTRCRFAFVVALAAALAGLGYPWSGPLELSSERRRT
jgi:hypothetical protein